MRWVPIVLVAVAGLAARHVWFAPHTSPVSVDTVVNRYHSEVEPRIFAGGIVEGAHPELSLRFEVSGRIKAVYVRQGDTVKAGDLLAELESDVAELNLAEANVRLEIAVAERDQLIADAKRLARRVTGDVVPVAGDQLHSASSPPNSGLQEPAKRARSPASRQNRAAAGNPIETAAVQAEPTQVNLTRDEQIIADGKCALAEAAVRRERLLLNQRRLLAPVDGLVLRATLEPGELTGPADDSAMLTLANCDAIHVRAFVEELDALRVGCGQRAAVIAAGAPDRSFSGVVHTCSPDVRPKSHRHLKAGERLDVRVREVLVELDDGAGLLIGLPVEVFIDPSQSPDTTSRANRASARP